jgi:hypothetical protein
MTEGLPPPPSDAPGPGWGDKYAPPAPSGDIAEYLRANGTRYTRQALDQRLLAAGHAPDAIAAAWATVTTEDEAAGRRDRRGQTAAIIGGAYLVTWLLVTLLAIIPSGGSSYSPVLLLSGILAVALFVPGIIAVAIARSTRWLRRAAVGRVVAFAFVPMLILFALAGTCVSVTQSIGMGQ